MTGVHEFAKCGETPFEGGRACENPMRLPMYDGPMETVKYRWVNIWCVLDWIARLAEIHFLDIYSA